MTEISHIIISNMRFSNKELLNKYLIITKDILIPSLKSQINKNFIWSLLILDEDIEYIKKELDFEFITFKNYFDFFNYVKDNNINIQTRHDIDDYMSEFYIKKIQELYIENIDKYDIFLIQSQPMRVDYLTKEEFFMPKYTENRNSMFLSLCQKNVNHHIFEKQHGQMYEISNNVITLPEGYTKWIIHGNNISCNRKNN